MPRRSASPSIPLLDAPPCPGCGAPASLVRHVQPFRRLRQVLLVKSWRWVCAGACVDPEAPAPPPPFSTAALDAWEGEWARQEWARRYGAPMPEDGRTQRHAERRVPIAVLLNTEELAHLDALRGRSSRSAFLRALLRTPKTRT